jgi:ribonuclease R/exosome complex exonuclease DIS3/RRP44
MSKKKKDLKRLERKILELFKNSPKAIFNYKQLASILEIRDTKGRNDIIRVLNQLNSKQIIVSTQRGKYHFNRRRQKTEEAILRIIPTGKGVVMIENFEEELIVPKKKLSRALDGDLVKISIHRKDKFFEAHVESIIERAQKEYVGILERQKDFAFVNCRNSRSYTDFFIEKKDLKDYKDGEKVVVTFKSWKNNKDAPHATIVKSLGAPGETETEIHAILHNYGLPYDFPQAVEQAAVKIPTNIDKKEVDKRRDFRKTLTFTIDPRTAKDFDDALSFKNLGDGKIEVGIHIADVSHYVTPNSELDGEAYERATSVYLVDRVVPMLPEALSNGLCSLRPNEEKLTFSAVFTLDSSGKVLKEWYGRTVIFSDYRFAYEEVQYMLEHQKPEVDLTVSLTNKKYSVPDNVFAAILELDRLAKILRKERMNKGAISFDRVEVNFNLNQDKKPDSVFFKSSKDANKLIEEFMLLANRKVATFIGAQQKKFPFVYRVHDDPDEEKLVNLKRTVSSFGYSFNPKGRGINKEINNLLLSCQGKKEQNLIDTLTLRCMSKAEYTTDNIGHYGLAFSHYTHFTSPIRRYPDVLVHRLLQTFLDKGPLVSENALEEACEHSSQREQLATKAERDSIKHMQMVFMEDKVGEEFEGVISGVTDRGLYVELIENKCEGMIRTVDMKEDYFYFDMDRHALIGERTKKVYQLGDPIKIAVKKVNIIKRFLDFVSIK